MLRPLRNPLRTGRRAIEGRMVQAWDRRRRAAGEGVMNFDTRTIVLVTRRLVKLAERPPLFNDRMTPAIISRRLSRILGWLGPCGRAVASDYIRQRELPVPGKREWSRRDWARPGV